MSAKMSAPADTPPGGSDGPAAVAPSAAPFAFTRLPDGTVIRWHAGSLGECRYAGCSERHATKAELAEGMDW